MPAPNLAMTIAAFVLLLGPLVLVHELGHYLVGRWFGVKADAFSVGFGKELFGWTDRRGTRWKISALPLGGYVQFAGDANPASPPSAAQAGRTDTLGAKPLGQRALIVLAGPLTNLLCAVAIFAGFNLAHGKLVASPVVAGFLDGSDARAAGVEEGDRIVAIEGAKVASALDIPQHVVLYPGRTVTLTVERAGRAIVVPVKLRPQLASDEFGNKSKVADLGIDFFPAVVDEMPAGSPAAAAGVKDGDRILAIGGAPVHTAADVVRLVKDRPGQTVVVDLARAGARSQVKVALQAVAERDEHGRPLRLGRLGVHLRSGDFVPVGPVEAARLAVVQTAGITQMMAAGIAQIFTGERPVSELGGPVTIARFSGEQLSLGWSQFVGFAALISINLAFINLLPIPALDGGHLAFYAAEAIRRKPLELRYQEWMFRTGLALVVALMLVVTFNDLAKLSGYGG